MEFLMYMGNVATMAGAFMVVGGVLVGLFLWAIDLIDALNIEARL